MKKYSKDRYLLMHFPIGESTSMAEDDMMSAVQKQLAPSVARRVAALFSNRRAYSF